MKRFLLFFLLSAWMLSLTGFAAADNPFDLDEQLDAIGREELMAEVPDDARELMEEIGVEELSAENLLQLSPGDFFRTIWRLMLSELQKPVRTLGVIAALVILCSMLNGMKTVLSEAALSQMFATVAALCILTSVAAPILDCVIETSGAVKDASVFMLTFIPVFSASLMAAGQPVTGAAYNMFLFSTCQVVAQVAAQTLIPLIGIYLAVCVVGTLAPEVKIASAANSVRSAVSWVLGFMVTIFVGLLSLQTMVSGGADSISARTAKFLIGSFVPVVGGALSEAFTAARGCVRLIKTSVGVYGILAAAFTFLPILARTFIWYIVTGLASMLGDVLGVGQVSSMMKSCSSALGILIAVILSFALLIIVSTAVVMATGLGAG